MTTADHASEKIRVECVLRVYTKFNDSEQTYGYFPEKDKDIALEVAAKHFLLFEGVLVERCPLGEWKKDRGAGDFLLSAFVGTRPAFEKVLILRGPWAKEARIPDELIDMPREVNSTMVEPTAPAEPAKAIAV